MQRIVLIDEDIERSRILARRLRAQGYRVELANNAVCGTNAALADPPAAVIADLWMTGISGIQLCRLFQLEPSTSGVPVVLRSTTDEPRNRFWARRAGAAGYVPKGRMGQLVRTLANVIKPSTGETFFTQLANSDIDIRDRIAAYLDEALFESVLAAEIRSLGACGSFDRLFDLFSQFVAEVTSYRWLAVRCDVPQWLGVHTNPVLQSAALAEVQSTLHTPADNELILIEDEDALAVEMARPPIVADLQFGHATLGQLALAPSRDNDQDTRLVTMLAREFATPLRMVGLVEESRRLAALDSLTGLLNRRSFMQNLYESPNTSSLPMGMLLLDIDRFKRINDSFGHATGDLVLARIGELLRQLTDADERSLAARWGGEEFVIAMPGHTVDETMEAAEGLRESIASMLIHSNEEHIPVTASIGVAWQLPGESVEGLIDRADRSMYLAKSSGRDLVCSSQDLEMQANA